MVITLAGVTGLIVHVATARGPDAVPLAPNTRQKSRVRKKMQNAKIRITFPLGILKQF